MANSSEQHAIATEKLEIVIDDDNKARSKKKHHCYIIQKEQRCAANNGFNNFNATEWLSSFMVK